MKPEIGPATVARRAAPRYHQPVRMLMYLLTRVLMLLAIFLALRSLWRILTGWQEPSRRSQFSRSKPIAGELKKDPNCGTYVSAEISLKSRLGNDEFHFCSRECQQEFLRARGAIAD